MKKSISMVLFLVVIFAGAANAYNFTDFLGNDRTITESGAPISYQHYIGDSVNFPAGDIITSATLTLAFKQDIPLLDFMLPEYVSYRLDNGNWVSLGEVDNGSYPFAVALNLLSDGYLSVLLSATDGCSWLGNATAYLDSSTLSGTAAPVPEPATLLLLGAGLIGLAGYGRKKI